MQSITLVLLAIAYQTLGFSSLPRFLNRRSTLMMADVFKVTLIDEAKKTSTTIEVPSDKYILEAALDAGVDMSYSCSAGTCSTCVGKCTSGEIDNSDQSTLDEGQLAKGFVLTCVAYPKSDCTILINEQQRSFQDY